MRTKGAKNKPKIICVSLQTLVENFKPEALIKVDAVYRDILDLKETEMKHTDTEAEADEDTELETIQFQVRPMGGAQAVSVDAPEPKPELANQENV